MTLLAFDIDGTIFDCGDIVADAFSEGARFFGAEHGLDLQSPTRDEIMGLVGIPTAEIFRRLFPGIGEESLAGVEALCQRVLSDMVRSGGGQMFEGVGETLAALHAAGYRICAASNGTIEYISAILETHGLMNFFERPILVIGGAIRSKSDIVRHYMKGLRGGELAIMVGDRFSDLEAARSNCIPFIGCSYGHAGSSDLLGQEWIARRFADIPALVAMIEDALRS